MAEEPGHKAMLYFLEVLMNSNGPLTISQLAGRFGSRSFTPEMRTAAGGNESGLKKFLLKYPSLFTVTGNMVSLFDSSKSTPSSDARDGSPSSNTSGRSLPDVSTEMEAVQYFQNKLSKKEERWVPIRSLAGHLSQACADVRNCVGPQLEFRKWLLRHPHIFEVQGELVGLRDGLAAVATPTITRRHLDGIYNGFGTTNTASVRIIPPRTPPPTRKFPPRTPPPVRRSHSFGEKRAPSSNAQPDIMVPPSTPGSRRRGAPVTMTANEYKAVMFLKDIVEKRGGIKVHNITGHFSQAHEGVRNTIGWTKMELEEFLKKHANVFAVSEDEVVSVIKNAKLNVIIVGSKPQGLSVRTLMGRKGKIFHVAKLWGIIDLGRHEHVFFDKSIMTPAIDDLQKDYRVGEILYFNAVLAPKTSRAKWRATHVWKEHEQQPTSTESDVSAQEHTYAISPSASIEEEINQFLPQEDYDKYVDAAPSGAGIVPVWNMKDDDNRSESTDRPSMVPESTYMNNSSLNDFRQVPDSLSPIPQPNSDNAKIFSYPQKDLTVNAIDTSAINAATNGESENKPDLKQVQLGKLGGGEKKTAEVACQTIATGVIIATQLYHEDL